MFDPPNPFSPQGSYFDLKKRITKIVQNQVDNQITELMAHTLEKTLSEQGVVLSRPEKKLLLRQITKTVLTDMLAKLDSAE